MEATDACLPVEVEVGVATKQSRFEVEGEAGEGPIHFGQRLQRHIVLLALPSPEQPSVVESCLAREGLAWAQGIGRLARWNR